MLPHRSVVVGRIEEWPVAMVFPGCVTQHKPRVKRIGTAKFTGEADGKGRNLRAVEDDAARVPGYWRKRYTSQVLAGGLLPWRRPGTFKHIMMKVELIPSEKTYCPSAASLRSGTDF